MVNELPFCFPIWDLKRIATQPKQPGGAWQSLITQKKQNHISWIKGWRNATGHSPWYVKPSKWTPAPGRPSASETPNGMSTNSFLRWGVDWCRLWVVGCRNRYLNSGVWNVCHWMKHLILHSAFQVCIPKINSGKNISFQFCILFQIKNKM